MASLEELDAKLRSMMDQFMSALTQSNEQMLKRIEDSVSKSELKIQQSLVSSIESKTQACKRNTFFKTQYIRDTYLS